jgi:membrane protease YdiL (CAAX protease family)
VPALASLGLFLGYLYARTGSLTLVILFHAIFNLRTLILTAMANQPSP